MTGLEERTLAQTENAYKQTVKACLVHFYAKSETEADNLVQAWWGRLTNVADTADFSFLHDEAIATAADLAKSREVPVTEANQGAYDDILAGNQVPSVKQEFSPLESRNHKAGVAAAAAVNRKLARRRASKQSDVPVPYFQRFGVKGMRPSETSPAPNTKASDVSDKSS